MRCITGSVTQVKHKWTWAGEGASFWATTTFTIGQQKVSLDTGSRSAIEDGDHVAVAGECQRDTLTALAYQNLSRDVRGDSGFAICLIPGLLSILFALVILQFSLVATALFAGFGTLSIRRAIRIRTAVHALESAP